MPARRHHFSTCGHFGFGVYCHRCKQVEDLITKGKRLHAANQIGDPRKEAAADAALREAARLKAS